MMTKIRKYFGYFIKNNNIFII